MTSRDSSLVIAVDHNACILCDRCVRGCNDIRDNQVIGRMGKGYQARIAFDLDTPMGNSTCVECGECMVSCPTGALTYRSPVQHTPPPGDRPLRVAYLGFPVAHKGWPIFRELVLKHAGDPRYAFVHLGAQADPGLPIEFHTTRVGAEQPRAMQAALEALEVDVVLFWPLWRETFSFTVYEAVAAGCAVITGPDSGNVAAVVAEGGHGWVAPDPAALYAAFASGEVARQSRARRKPVLYDLKLSGMTVDLLPARAEA